MPIGSGCTRRSLRAELSQPCSGSRNGCWRRGPDARKGEPMIEKPPPILGNGRLLEYVIVDESVTYSGHSSLFVGNPTGGLKELGPVPCLAITKDLNTGEIALLHCDDEWDLLGMGG